MSSLSGLDICYLNGLSFASCAFFSIKFCLSFSRIDNTFGLMLALRFLHSSFKRLILVLTSETRNLISSFTRSFHSSLSGMRVYSVIMVKVNPFAFALPFIGA